VNFVKLHYLTGAYIPYNFASYIPFFD